MNDPAERTAGTGPPPADDQATTGRLERIRAGLRLGALSTTSSTLARQADREAMETFRSAADADELLGSLETELIAGLLERAAGRLETPATPIDDERQLCRDVLDLVRRPALLRRIAPDAREAWASAILRAIDASNFTVGSLLRQRAETYGGKVLFRVPRGDGYRGLTFRQVASRVDFLARGLLSLDSSDTPAPVAILSENRLEMALCDLACLSAGLVNVLIPANATETDVGYMLRHSRAGTVIVSDARQLDKVLRHRESLPALSRIVTLDPIAPRRDGVLSLDELSARALHIPESLVLARSEAVRVGDLATVMYTSGTTGMPKGICFSHRNLVFKRFARALALPEIGDGDRFLCFLPLFHTFGRFLEMMGCLFWGATYCFLENPAADAMVRGMERHRPTVFISVPKKWLELYEAIGRIADPLSASDDELAQATAQVTGGNLRWGISAAGHLPSEVFRFFQRRGIELVSGFGMTEATGGITMTPPGEYDDDSLGVALPGIELKHAADGELLVRGPYVMMGYLDPPDGEPSFGPDGWLPTGDLMEVDRKGHIRLIDRKKEIYKNIKGETIAPQRVENPFRDFESVGRAFLVGDHREYNTLLIWPNPAYTDLDLSRLSDQEVWNHFRSLVVSVNQFLAPYERIVDFAILDRDLDASKGELTEKGSPKRRTVEQNFAELIRTLYRRTDISVGGVTLTLPNWLFQVTGLTAQHFRVGSERLVLSSRRCELTVRALEGGRALVGDTIYAVEGTLNLGTLLTAPSLWLGNDELVRFVELSPGERIRPGRRFPGVEWVGPAQAAQLDEAELRRLEEALERPRRDLLDLHLAARAATCDDEAVACRGIDLAGRVLDDNDVELVGLARQVLGRAADGGSAPVARSSLVALAGAEPDTRFEPILRRFLLSHPDILDDETRARLVETSLSPTKVEALVSVTDEACQNAAAADGAGPLLDLLAGYGAVHPGSYRRLRAVLTRLAGEAATEAAREHAAIAASALVVGFRAWLGPTAQVAIDPDTGREYRWRHVVVFEEGIEPGDRRRLLVAIERTAFLREACFLFAKGALIQLSDVPPGGVWVRHLGTRHGKAVFRVTVQSRAGAYDLAVNVNHDRTPDQVREEIRWLIVCGDPGARAPLVEDFGGYWPDQDLWSEEFISGETLDRAMVRLGRREDGGDRLAQIWPFLLRSTLAAFADFWNRTGRTLQIADAGLANIVVPTEDYHVGTRIVSVAERRPQRSLLGLLRGFREQVLEAAVVRHPELRGVAGTDAIFSALPEVVGEARAIEAFEAALADPGGEHGELLDDLRRYVERIRSEGYRPKRLHFAIARYVRWEQLSGDATREARARTLQELYETYLLHRLVRSNPEVRFRLFRDTVFREAPATLADGLDDLIRRIRTDALREDEFVDAVADLRSKLDLTPDDEYFLARISLPYLRPEDAAGFVSSSLGGRQQSEIVVATEDLDGHVFRMRHAMSPREVERLHRLFLAARLEVQFRAEHRYLVAINDREQIIAGIYYEIEEGGRSAHLEKIVAAEAYRRRGVADCVMREFFNRLRAAGVQTVTTGFFRPEYFYTYGFRIEKRHAGLVKSLEEPAPA